MENYRTVTVIYLSLAVLFFTMPAFSHAYSTVTHNSLTQNTFETYNTLVGETFSTSDIAAAAGGSVAEDNGSRPLNHFYDPVNDSGLRRNIWRDGNPFNGLASVAWVVDVLGQGKPGRSEKLFSGDTDFSWERSVYEYVHGDKKRAMEALGHVLHLVQDATVPAHARNDAHPTPIVWQHDPYEEFTAGLGSSVSVRSSDIPQISSIQDAIRQASAFTNENFLSKDTVFSDYNLPQRKELRLERILSEGSNQYFGVGEYGKMLRIKQDVNRWTREVNEEYYFYDKENLIQKDYWSILSKQAVGYGVGVLDVFMRLVEEERRTQALLYKNKSYGEVKSFANVLARALDDSKPRITSLAAADVVELNDDEVIGLQEAAKIYGIPFPAVAHTSVLNDNIPTSPQNQAASALSAFQSATQSVGDNGGQIDNGGDQTIITVIGMPVEIQASDGGEQTILPAPEAPADNPTQDASAPPPPPTTSDQPAPPAPSPFEPGGFAYGSGGGGATIPASDDDNAEDTGDDSDEENENDPEAESLLEPPTVASPAHGAVLATTTVEIVGTAAAGVTVHVEVGTTTATTTASEDGVWGMALTFPEGETELTLWADDGDNVSDEITITLTVDLTAPDAPDVVVAACEYSLSEDMCLLASTNVEVTWEGVEGALEYRVYADEELSATTTATSTDVDLDDQTTTIITVTAVDAADNESASGEITVDIFEQPVVINEIAWAGTDFSDDDEWIELYNRSSYDITLDNMTLKATDGVPEIALSGTIASGGYYLIERGEDGATTSVDEDIRVPFSGSGGGSGLHNSGEQLQLLHTLEAEDVVLDSTPTVDTCGGWCAGGEEEIGFAVEYGTSTGLISMERTGADADGTQASSWASNDTYTNNGTDADENIIYGTPRAANSKHLPRFGWYCNPDDSSVVEGETYLPQTTGCVYLSAFIRSDMTTKISRYGGPFKGEVGNATKINRHSLGKNADKKLEKDEFLDVVAGDPIFIAIWEIRKAPHNNDVFDFTDYFEGTATTTPHDNFRVLNWVMGGDTVPADPPPDFSEF
jgi:hypothetical protein